jgi:hypothetical protein
MPTAARAPSSHSLASSNVKRVCVGRSPNHTRASASAVVLDRGQAVAGIDRPRDQAGFDVVAAAHLSPKDARWFIDKANMTGQPRLWAGCSTQRRAVGPVDLLADRLSSQSRTRSAKGTPSGVAPRIAKINTESNAFRRRSGTACVPTVVLIARSAKLRAESAVNKTHCIDDAMSLKGDRVG